MDEDTYNQKLEALKQAVKSHDTAEFSTNQDEVEEVERFGNLGVELKGGCIYKLINELLREGIFVTDFFPKQNNVAYFAPVKSETKTVTETIEKEKTILHPVRAPEKTEKRC
jgi:hypothetical protein